MKEGEAYQEMMEMMSLNGDGRKKKKQYGDDNEEDDVDWIASMGTTKQLLEDIARLRKNKINIK